LHGVGGYIVKCIMCMCVIIERIFIQTHTHTTHTTVDTPIRRLPTHTHTLLTHTHTHTLTDYHHAHTLYTRTHTIHKFKRRGRAQEDCPSLTDRSCGTQGFAVTSHHYMKQEQLSIYFPSYHQVPIDVTAGWAVSSKHQIPIQQLGRLEQCFLIKETTTIPKCLERESNLQPFNYQAGVLTTWLCCLTHLPSFLQRLSSC